MKRRLFVIALVLLLLVAIILCPPIDTWDDELYATNDKYRIQVDENGNFYILRRSNVGYLFAPYTANNNSVYTDTVSFHEGQTKYSSFQTVAEMKEAILNGTVILDDIPLSGEGIRHYIHNLEQLYTPILPSDISHYAIAWQGGRYTYYFNYDELIPGRTGAYPYLEVQYGKTYDSVPRPTFDEKKVLDKEVSVSDRNATALHYTYHYTNYSKESEQYVILLYTLSANGRTVYVKEHYDADDYSANKKPRAIYLYGTLDQTEQISYMVYLTGFDTRPSEAYLLSFGLKPYVEAE